MKPPTNGMTPVYLEPKPEPYLVHHLENSQHSSCTASNPATDNETNSTTVRGSPSLNLPTLSPTKHDQGSMKIEENSVGVKTDDPHSSIARPTIITNHELTNMQPAPPSSYNPYSPIQYNVVGV